ncbi:MAG: DUF2497 domain-containing protein [Hyphomicrobiales bacterium]
MSAAEPIAEPSMEEILASIRKAISEDHSLSAESGPDPFGADSPATNAFSNSSDGVSFDTAEHARHDPFAELNAKLEQQAQREELPTRDKAPEPAADTVVKETVVSQDPKSVFDEIEEVFSQRKIAAQTTTVTETEVVVQTVPETTPAPSDVREPEPLAAFVPSSAEKKREDKSGNEDNDVISGVSKTAPKPQTAITPTAENLKENEVGPAPKAGDFKPFSDAFAAQKKKLSQTAFKAPESRKTDTVERATTTVTRERPAPSSYSARPQPQTASPTKATSSDGTRRENSFSERIGRTAGTRKFATSSETRRESERTTPRTLARETSSRTAEQEEGPRRPPRNTEYTRVERDTPRNTDFSARSNAQERSREEPRPPAEILHSQVIAEAKDAMRPSSPVSEPAPVGDASSKTIEQFLQEMLTPMLNEWLDRNLSRIIEDVVRKEFEQSFNRRG